MCLLGHAGGIKGKLVQQKNKDVSGEEKNGRRLSYSERFCQSENRLFSRISPTVSLPSGDSSNSKHVDWSFPPGSANAIIKKKLCQTSKLEKEV